MENLETYVLKLKLFNEYTSRISALKFSRILWTCWIGFLFLFSAVTLITAIVTAATASIVANVILLVFLAAIGYLLWSIDTAMIKSYKSKLADLEEPTNG